LVRLFFPSFVFMSTGAQADDDGHNSATFHYANLAIMLCLATVGIYAVRTFAPPSGQWLLGPPPAGQPVANGAPSTLDCASQPLLSGPLNASQPPYFFPTQCALRAWSPAAAQDCLRGRRIFILGNSIARGFGFELLASFFEGPIVQRKDQKGECKPSCTIPLVWNAMDSFATNKDETNMSVELSWTQRLGPHMPWCDKHFDPCLPREPKQCLQDELSGSRPGDLLVTYMGLQYPYIWADWDAVQRTGKTLTCEGANADYREAFAAMSDDDFEQATVADLEHWVDAVESAWGGLPEHVFRVRLAPVGDYWASGKWAHRVAWLNGLFDTAVQGKQWGTVDQYGINQGPQWDYDEDRVVIPPHYSDHLHFGGVLSKVTWEVVLGRLCPHQVDDLQI
jgi:hypothetical protein